MKITNKTDYIIRQIAKSYNKTYENYVVTRIWHLLNNLDIKFVTQQHVTRPTGRALTDMYFPQIQLHIEIDEPSPNHFNKDGSQVEKDIAREADIINVAEHTSVKRISALENNIESINQQIDELVSFIKKEIDLKKPTPWDFEAEYNPKTYIDRGSISVDDNVAFRTIAHACNCFGHDYVGYQKAFAKHAIEEKMLWFPKLYENEGWENAILPDETEIHERNKTDHAAYFEQAKNNLDNLKERITFARVRSNLGDVMYRFKGVYKLDLLASEHAEKIIYKKTSDKVKTYKPIKQS